MARSVASQHPYDKPTVRCSGKKERPGLPASLSIAVGSRNGEMLRHAQHVGPIWALRRGWVCGILLAVSAKEIIEQFKALPPEERAEVAKFVLQRDDSWIPASFQQGMADAEAGRFANDMETVLGGAKPPLRNAK